MIAGITDRIGMIPTGIIIIMLILGITTTAGMIILTTGDITRDIVILTGTKTIIVTDQEDRCQPRL